MRSVSRGNPRENFLLAVAHEPPIWLPCPIFDESVVSIGHGIAERMDHGKDAWGVEWEVRNERSSSFPTWHPISSPEMVEDYIFPSVGTKLFAPAAQKTSRYDRKDVILFGDNGWGIFERAWLLLGMRRFFVWSYRYPDALKSLITEIAETKLELTEGLLSEVGVDIVGYGDDWSMEDGLLLPRRLWRNLIKPWLSKLYDKPKENDAMVYQHSDGKVEELVPDIIELGVDLLNVQRECDDWKGLMNRYGSKITMWGGVSARTLDLGSHDDIASEVEECCRLGRNGGVILAPGHALKYPKEKVSVMRETWTREGFYREAQING